MRLGFMLSGMNQSIIAKQFIESANLYLADNHKDDIIAFVNNQEKPIVFPVFSFMNMNEAFDYSGSLVATDFYTAKKLVNMPGPKYRIYYIWEIDWFKDDNMSFENTLSIFHDPRISIVARTMVDKKVIESCWNCKVEAVIDNCSIKEFVELTHEN